MKCIITDDEKNSRETLRHLLAAVAPEIIVLAEAANTKQAADYIETLQPDILFLDINMPGESGIEFVEKNGPFNCHIVFTTAYNEYAVKAFRLNAMDFLLKPIDPDELVAAIEKAKNQPQRIKIQQLENVKEILQTKEILPLQRLALTTSEGIHFIRLNDIIYAEAMGSYSKFHIENHKPIIVSKGLKEYDDLLTDYHFLRVHQSYVVNLNYVAKYVKGDGGQIWMSDGTEIEVSRRKKEEVIEALKKIAIK